jgi:hypothetical protein
MNSADMCKSTKSDPGMEVLGHDIGACFQSLTSGRGTELFLCHAGAAGPEVQLKLSSIQELMKQRMTSPFPDCWKMTGC